MTSIYVLTSSGLQQPITCLHHPPLSPFTTTSPSSLLFFTTSINLLLVLPPACQSQPQRPPCRRPVDCLLSVSKPPQSDPCGFISKTSNASFPLEVLIPDPVHHAPTVDRHFNLLPVSSSASQPDTFRSSRNSDIFLFPFTLHVKRRPASLRKTAHLHSRMPMCLTLAQDLTSPLHLLYPESFHYLQKQHLSSFIFHTRQSVTLEIG